MENNNEEFVWDEAEALRRIEQIKNDHLKTVQEEIKRLIEHETNLYKIHKKLEWLVFCMGLFIYAGSWLAEFFSKDPTHGLTKLMYYLVITICFFGTLCWRQLVIISLNTNRRQLRKETVHKFFVIRQVHEQNV